MSARRELTVNDDDDDDDDAAAAAADDDDDDDDFNVFSLHSQQEQYGTSLGACKSVRPCKVCLWSLS